jgi:hypothetical protein
MLLAYMPVLDSAKCLFWVRGADSRELLRLRSLDNALRVFADNHGNELPRDMNELVTFLRVRPGWSRELEATFPNETIYNCGLSRDREPKRIIGCDPRAPRPWKGRFVLFSDGMVKWLWADELRAEARNPANVELGREMSKFDWSVVGDG